MPVLKRILRAAGFLVLVLLAFAVGAVAVLTLSERGRENLAGLVSALTSSPGRAIGIAGLGGIWSGELTIDEITVGDDRGTWLTAKGVVVDWSPLSLLSATFAADRIFAERVEVARLPEGGAEGEAGGTMPVSLALRDIDLPRIELGRELSGGVASLAAQGSAFVEAAPLEVRTELRMERTDGRAGSVDARVQFAPARNVLDVDVTASEPSGGIIANLLQLPGEPAVDIVLSGSGPAADWSGRGSFALDGTVVTTLTGQRRSTATGHAIAARGEGEFERFVPAAFRPLVSGRTVFDVAGSATNAGRIEIERAAFESQTVRGSASGIVDPQAASDLAVELAAKAEAGVPLAFGGEGNPIEVTVRSASLRAAGAGEAPKLDVEATLAGISTRSVSLDDVTASLHSDAFNIESRSGPVAGTVAAGSVVADDPTLRRLLAGVVSAELSGTLTTDSLEIASGRLASDAMSGTFAGSVSLVDGSASLDVTADMASAALPAAVRGPLGERTAISGRLVRDAAGRLAADPFALTAAGISAQGRIAAAGPGIEASFRGELADLGSLSGGVSGAAAISGTLSGDRSAPDFSIAADGERIVAYGREISGVRLTASGKADPGNPAAEIALAGTLADETLSASGSVSAEAGRPIVKGLQLSLGPNRLSGDVRLGERFLPYGILEFDLPELASLAGLAGETLSGNLGGTLRLDMAEGRPRAVVVAQSASLGRGDIEAADAAVNATILDYLGQPKIAGQIRAGTLRFGDTVASGVDVSLEREGAWTTFDGRASVSGVPAAAKGRLSIADGATTIEVAEGGATVRGIEAAISQPSTIRVSGGDVHLDGLTLDVGGATAVVTGKAGSAWDLNATLTAPNEGMNLSLGTPESPIDLVLRSASLKAVGPRDAPALDVAAALSSAATKEARLQSLDLTLHSDAFDIASRTGPVTGQAAAAAVSLNNAALQPLITGRLEASLAGMLGADRLDVTNGSVASEALTGRFSGNVSLTTGQILLQLNADVAAGALPAAARGLLAERSTVSGSLSRDTEGRLLARDIEFQSGALEAAGTASLDGAALQASMTGSLADVGLLSEGAAGAVEFALEASGPAAAPEVSLTLSSERIQAAGREIAGLRLTAEGKADPANPAAEISLTGTVGGETLRGSATLSGSGGARSIEDLSLTLGQNSVSGGLVLGDNFLPRGTVDFSLPDLGAVAALALERVEGDLAGTLRFETGEPGPRIIVEAQSGSAARGEISATGATVTATIADYLVAPTITGRVRASSVTVGGTVIADADVALSQEAGWTLFDGGASVTGVPARVAGRVRFENGTTTVEVREGAASVGGVGIAVAGPSTIRIAGGDVHLDGLTLDVDGATAVVTGSAGSAWDLNATLTAPAEGMELSFGTPQSPIDIVLRSASLKALGDRAAPKVDLGASLSGVATRDARLASVDLVLRSDAFDIASRTGPVTGTAAAAALTLANASLQPLISGTIRAEVAGRLGADALSVTSGTIASDAMTGSFDDSVSLDSGAIRLDIEADVAASALPGPVRGVLAERVALAAVLNRDAEGRITAEGLRLESGGLAATGSAALDGETLQAAASGRLADVGVLSEGASGSLDFVLDASGPATGPDLSLTVSSDRLQAAGREIVGLRLTAQGKADPANPQARLSLAGTVGGDALQGSATLSGSGGTRSVSDLSLTLGQNRISGDLVLDENFVPRGTVDFSLPDLGSVAALALETAEGDLAGTISFTEAGGKPLLSIDARTAAISRGDISARDVVVNATVADYMASPALSGRVRASSAGSGATAARDIDVALTRDGSWTGFDGAATVAGVPVRARGRLQIAGQRTTVELASAQATVRGLQTSLARPARVVVENGVATLDQLALGLGGGTAVVSGRASATLDLDVRLSDVPASLANGFAPALAAGGSISGRARISGAASNPTVDYSLDWAEAETAQTRAAGLGAMRVTSSGNFAGGRLTFDARAADASGIAMSGRGNVDTRSRTISADVSGPVPFDFLTGRLAAQGLSLSGVANASLQVRGALASPAITGSLRSSGARLVDSRSGIALDGISADISLAGGRATIRSLTGTLSTSGSLSASGSVGIEPGQGFPADLTIRISDARYTDGRVVTTTMNGNLALKGPLASTPTLSGTVILGRTVITVPERLPASLSRLDVEHRNAPAAVRRQQQALRPAERAGGGAAGLALDLTVDAGNQIFVQGRGLDAELGGSLRLTGPVSAPQANGRFTLRRGRLTIIGKRLTFTRGTIDFPGSLVPWLDLSADSDVGDTTVTVTISGPANNPTFHFSSVPALPEDEVLARLIFGRSLNNLSPLQIAQLAEAAAQFAGIGGSTTLLEKLRSQIGIDDLDVRTDEQGGTSVSVGKYLNDRTYLSLEKGDRAGSGKAKIDLEVGRGVKLRGEASETGEAKGGIFFEREY